MNKKRKEINSEIKEQRESKTRNLSYKEKNF